MFGGKKKSEPKKEAGGKRKGADLMNQLGFGPLPGMDGMEGMGYGDDDEDDDDLEAELAALAGEDDTPKPRKKPKKKSHMPIADIEKMAALGMKDIDEDVSDTEDPDLLAELEELSDEDEEPSPPPVTHSPQKTKPTQPQPSQTFQPTLPSPKSAPSPIASPSLPSPTQQKAVSPQNVPAPRPSTAGGIVGLLEDRVAMYKQALANAKSAGDSSKQRRLDRGLKSLVGMLRQAKSGKAVNEDDIPPPVGMGSSIAAAATPSPAHTPSPAVTPQANTPVSPMASPTKALPSPSTSMPDSKESGNEDVQQSVIMRRDQYKKAAAIAKHNNDMETAKKYVKIAMQFDAVIKAMADGNPVDLSKMPPPPPELAGSSVLSVKQPLVHVAIQRSSKQAAGEDKEPEPEMPSVSADEEKTMFNAPEAPRSVMEALTQRLEKYKSSESSAKEAGDSSKARRLGRIVKQYQDAIKAYKAGKPVEFEDLPTPPGFGPIPQGKAPPQPTAKPAPAAVSPSASGSSQAPPPAQKPAAAAARPAMQRQPSQHKSRIDQQKAFLVERREEFKKAALQAKKKQDLELAKKYIRMAMGLNPMIEALEAGLPVDLSQVPSSPNTSEDSEDKFVVVSAEDCTPTGDREEVFKSLQQDLVRQIRVCVTNGQHYQKLGDVPASSKFQKLEQNCRKDLDSLKSAYRHGDPVPRFHYETRSFTMVQCNTELGDADLEVNIIRGIQYNLPSGYSEKDMDTFVKYEFAYPTDDQQTGSTGTIKDTINPEYNTTVKLQFNRSNRGLHRFVERKSLKCEVFYKRGLFKGDKLLGTANVKLQPLEQKCTIHESYDLVEGRKTVGGKLEVKLRVRDPLKNKQVEEVREKWLVIDQFIRTAGSRSQADAKSPKTTSEGSTCMEVLRFEKQLLDKQISQLKDSLSLTQTQALKHKSALLEEKLELQQKKLREGGTQAWKAYLVAVQTEARGFEQEARNLAKIGEMQKAEVLMSKKKQAEKEMAAVKAKIPGV